MPALALPSAPSLVPLESRSAVELPAALPGHRHRSGDLPEGTERSTEHTKTLQLRLELQKLPVLTTARAEALAQEHG